MISLCSVSPPLLAAPSDNASSRAKEQSGQNNGSDNGKPDKPGKDDAVVARPPAALPATNGDATLALEGVVSNDSVELKAVLAAVATITSGRMIDIEPMRIGGRLYYDVTVVETAGMVRHILVDARTGKARSIP